MPPRYATYDAKGIFDEAETKAALAADVRGHLKFDLHFNGPQGSGPAGVLQRRLDAEWERMSAAQRAPHEAEARRRDEHLQSYGAGEAPKAAASAPLLLALLARCSQVHTVDLTPRQYEIRATSYVRLSSGMVPPLCASWGASLRFARLGRAELSADDIHALLAACPQLALLQLRLVTLAAGSLQAIFGDAMAPHPALRSVGLPPVIKSLPALVERLTSGKCPALVEVDANSFDATRGNGCDVVARVARRAASRGVRRFICDSFFYGGGSDGEWGSDGGSVGEYCGDGNVLKYVC